MEPSSQGEEHSGPGGNSGAWPREDTLTKGGFYSAPAEGGSPLKMRHNISEYCVCCVTSDNTLSLSELVRTLL